MNIEELYKIYLSHSTICTDTRKIKDGSLFFALKGDNFNGNQFASIAIEQGADYAIIDKEEYRTSEKCILVDDVLTTLQKLANYHRKQLNIPFIGITGTNGKTTTKELINAVLSTTHKTIATAGNLNNHIGVPLTLLSIPLDCEIAIIEMGANHIGEIDFLCKIAEPNYGIITNIGTAHIEGFGSKEGIVQTKNELYQSIQNKKGLVFINKDDTLLNNLAKDIQQYSYGTNNANCTAQILSSTPFVTLKWKEISIASKLYGKYNFENILTAICIGSYFKISEENCIKAIENYTPSNNRSEVVEMNENTYYLDAYNANPSSMNAAIDTFYENAALDKIMILGDMLELGNISNEEHQNIVDKVHALNLTAVFVGNTFNSINNKYNFEFVANAEEAKILLQQKKLSNYHILIKGSRGIQLEKVIQS